MALKPLKSVKLPNEVKEQILLWEQYFKLI